MIFLLLAIVCSTAIVVVFKLAGPRTDGLELVTVNYAAAVAAGLVLLQLDPPAGGLAADPALLGLGGLLGLLFVAGFVLLGTAIRDAGMSLATATMRLSVALPFVASWLIWNETPSPGQAMGLVVAGAAFVLISRPSGPGADLPTREGGAPPRHRHSLRAALLLLLLFLVGGMVDTSLKVFQEEFSADSSQAHFLLVVFAVALAIGVVLITLRSIRRRRWPADRRVLGWGTALGLVNYASAEFMLRALRDIPGTVAFPVNNVAVVTLALLLGMGLWKESPSRGQRMGLGLALLALALFGL